VGHRLPALFPRLGALCGTSGLAPISVHQRFLLRPILSSIFVRNAAEGGRGPRGRLISMVQCSPWATGFPPFPRLGALCGTSGLAPISVHQRFLLRPILYSTFVRNAAEGGRGPRADSFTRFRVLRGPPPSRPFPSPWCPLRHLRISAHQRPSAVSPPADPVLDLRSECGRGRPRSQGQTHFLQANTAFRAPVIANDILPTLCAATGATIPKESRVDGVNLLPYLRGERSAPPHDLLYWKVKSAAALRRGDWKLVMLAPDWKLQLYNLRDDVSETRDLAAQEPAITRELYAAWSTWNEPLPPPARKSAEPLPAYRPASP